MRINQFVARATGLSRRAADEAIKQGRVTINQKKAVLGDSAKRTDQVTLDNRSITPSAKTLTIMLNKPVGYVSSRAGQGSKTIYDLLPEKYHDLKPIGRLDKNSSGLLLLTSDGELANQLTHPRYAKSKIYQIEINKPLEALHQKMINDKGVELEDGLSQLNLMKLDKSGKKWQVTMSEGRNRQIRRTFATLGYKTIRLHRIRFGDYILRDLTEAKFKPV